MGKSRGRENEERRRRSLYSSAKKQAEATQGPFPMQRDATDGHDMPGTPKKVTGHVA